jgi:hypothetical protein
VKSASPLAWGSMPPIAEAPGAAARPAPNYGSSPATICLDFYAPVPFTPFDVLLGQRAISKAQLAREGNNVRVVRHVRESLYKSYKELFVDVTGKLPAFARAILPQFVLYMENQVNYPQNTAALVCISPSSLRGACAFSETLYCEPGEAPAFTIRPPAGIALPHECRPLDYTVGWKPALRDRAVKGVVFKRFLLDVRKDNLVFRRIRAFMISKFCEAFTDMLREVETCLASWEAAVPRPRFESSAVAGDVAPVARLWPVDGESIAEKSKMLVKEFAQSVHRAQVPRDDEPRQRASSSFLYPAD